MGLADPGVVQTPEPLQPNVRRQEILTPNIRLKSLLGQIMLGRTTLGRILVELTGIEPVASWLQTRRSPS